ncbi:MAG: NAD/NADP octopine/nopaline dehydrogenase family protein [Candidatus Pelethousia sp.]|nr:NAD/NADP octopine/nopaline dehydrogenase family protein [Candidatus Pelethousia sp.]
MNQRVTVIGNGALSLSVAAQFANRGATVVYVDAVAKEAQRAPAEIHVIGLESYTAHFAAITHRYDSISLSDLLVIATTASFHAEIFEQAAPFIRDGQTIVFFPACFGAIGFAAYMQKRAVDVTVCEAASFICVCEMQGKDTICMQNKKSSVRLAVKPAKRMHDTIAMLNKTFDVFQPAGSFLETSLDNINLTLHPLPLLLNIAAAERDPQSFHHYTDGISPTVGRLMERLDSERLSVGNAFGLKLTSAYDQLVQYYGERGLDSLAAYASSSRGPYTEVKGYGLDSRYVREDVPYLLVEAAALGKCAGVETPVMNLCINLASLVTGIDYSREGATLERTGMAKLTKDEILKRI